MLHLLSPFPSLLRSLLSPFPSLLGKVRMGPHPFVLSLSPLRSS